MTDERCRELTRVGMAPALWAETEPDRIDLLDPIDTAQSRTYAPRNACVNQLVRGAHAAVDRLERPPRDSARARTYFPTVQLIAPDVH